MPDFDDNGEVDARDFDIFTAAWGSYDWRCDLNGDGYITNQDTGILIDYYGAAADPARGFSGNTVGFTSQRIDRVHPDSFGRPQLTLMHYKNRAYWPELGRFGQRDPLGYVRWHEFV